MWPYARLIGGALKKASALDIKMIAPAHGVIWRSKIAQILEKYAAWGTGVNGKSVVIAYDTMWGGTEALARAMVEGAAAAGVKVQLMRMDRTPCSTVAAELFEAGGLLVGSPTLNSGMMPTIGGMLVYLKGLQPKGKKRQLLAPAAGQAVHRKIWKPCLRQEVLICSPALTANGVPALMKPKQRGSLHTNLQKSVIFK